MFRKITRILLKSLLVLLVLIILLGTSLYFAIQSHSFQTWAAQKAAGWLSSETGAEISIERIRLDFFIRAELHHVLIKDQKKDTIFYGNLVANIRDFNRKEQRLLLKNIALNDATINLTRQKQDSSFNFQFLADYFSSNKKDTTTSSVAWQFDPGNIEMNNLKFRYYDGHHPDSTGHNINYSNIYLKNTYATLSGLKFNKDTILATIHNLKTIEQCGLEIKGLYTIAKISSAEVDLKCLELKTGQSNISGDIRFSHKNWDSYSEFPEKVHMQAHFDSSEVSLDDISVFVPDLNGLKEIVKLHGEVKGTVSELDLNDFRIRLGTYTGFEGSMHLSGLPDIENAFLHFDAKSLSFFYRDIERLPAYPFNEGKKIVLPQQVRQLGFVSYKGKFDGFMKDFTTYGKFTTSIGSIRTEVSIQLGEKTDDIRYKGRIHMSGFNIGALAGTKDLRNMSLDLTLKGKGLSIGKINAEAAGKLNTIDYNGYTYHDVVLDGHFKEKVFNGKFKCADQNANFDFDGKIDFRKKIPEMDFISTINNFDLKATHFTKTDSRISTQALILLKGDNLNNLTGGINFDNTIYHSEGKDYKFSSFDLQLDQEKIEKEIIFNTSFFNFNMRGRYVLTNLPTAFNHFLHSYYPAFVDKVKPKSVFTDEFSYSLKIKKFNVISELFISKLMISPNTIIKGNFDATKNILNLQMNSDSLRYGTTRFYGSAIESYSQNNKINLVLKSNEIQLSDSISLHNYFSYFVSKDKDTKFNLEWNNKTVPNNTGRVFGKFSFNNSFATFNFDKFFITARDSTWNLVEFNPTVIDTGGNILIKPLLFKNGNQSIALSGALTGNTGDSLKLITKNVVLEQFNPLFGSSGMKLAGELSGLITLSDKKEKSFQTDIETRNLKVNNNLLGKLVLKSDYTASRKSLYLDGYTSMGILSDAGIPMKNIAFNGHYYTDEREETIDIGIKAAPANLKILNPLLDGILTIKDAFIKGDGRVHGSAKNILVDGNFNLFSSEIKVDYTNVTYNITGGIEIMPDQIRFSDLLLKEKGLRGAPQGTLNGNIFHSSFSRMQLDYDITYRNMLVLNTTEKENKTFYGKIYGTGNVGIWGFLNNMHMQVIDTITKNSKFYMPLDGPAEVEENDFIHFVKKDSVRVKKEEGITGFNLDMFINATPDCQAQIILDKRTGDILNVEGQGDLTMKINTLGKFDMIGDYFITDGDYRFTLENVINKKFEIEPGSNISWSGDPLGAKINIVTKYRQRASVAPLLNDTTGTYKGRVPVECKLKISDKLFSPDIKFGIEFPTIDATARSRIDNLLSDEMELNRQVFAFLLFRSFVTPQIYNANAGGVTAGNAAASTGSELLSNQVSSFLNSYVGNLTGLGDLQLGLNYRPGTQTNSEAVDLALSKQLFNNKVSIDGNFGVNSNQTSRNSSGIIDVNIEYKLTEDGRFRVKGFNRSNDVTQITTTGGPYTQGIGLFYREEFETVNQLFKRYMEKIKGKDQTKSSN